MSRTIIVHMPTERGWRSITGGVVLPHGAAIADPYGVYLINMAITGRQRCRGFRYDRAGALIMQRSLGRVSGLSAFGCDKGP